MHPQDGCARQLDRKAGRPRFELGEIFRAHIDAFRDRHTLSPLQAQVVRAICACRTAQLGGHLDVCLDCGYKRPAYNSCRNRHCPKCQALDQHRWLERCLSRILPVAYFHVVFTLPGELASVGLRNRRLVYELLFRAAASTLLTLGKDPERLGALLGLTMVLHTWTRDLRFHPHVHVIVTGGGLRSDGQRWLSTGGKYLFPVKLLGSLYRGKFLGHLARAHKDGQLDLPEELAADGCFDRLLDKLYATDWVVYAKRPFAGPEQVFSYLGRYTHRVALSNHRILDVTQKAITLATRHGKTVTLSPEELIRRFLLHVLPRRFPKIRHYGLMASANVHSRLERARALLQPTDADTQTETGDAISAEPQATDELMQRLTGIDPTICPACQGSRLQRFPLDIPTHARPPPAAAA